MNVPNSKVQTPKHLQTDKKIKRPLIPEHCASWTYRQYVHSTGKSYTTFQDSKSPKYGIVVSQAFMKRNIQPVFKSFVKNEQKN